MNNKAYIELLFSFFRRDWLVRYGNGYFGYLILLANPLAFLGLKLFIQSQVMQPLQLSAFLYGLMWWILLSSTLANAAAVASSYADLVRKASFPRSILFVLPVLIALCDFLIGLLLYLLATCYFEAIPFNFLSMLVSLLTVLPFLFGISAILVTLIFRFRKMRFAIPFIILAAFITTPFFFNQNTQHLGFIHYLNPFSLIVQNEQPTPVFACIVGLCYLVIGILFFRHHAARLADY